LEKAVPKEKPTSQYRRSHQNLPQPARTFPGRHRAPHRIAAPATYSRVENGHTVPRSKLSRRSPKPWKFPWPTFFSGTETPRDKETQKMLGELSQDEIRFLAEIKKYSTTLSEGDKRLGS